MLLALVIGLLLPVQVGINVELARRVASPVTAGLISFAVGTAVLIFCGWAMRISMPSWNTVAAFPAWLWLGGLIGALAVFGGIVAGPRIGLLALVALVLAGQLIASLFLDYYGWLGFPVQELSWGRVTGSALLFASVVLIHKY